MTRPRIRRVSPVVWAAPLLAACAGADPVADPRSHTVEMREMAFVPAELRVNPGDTIVWINRDIVPHTATAPDSAWSSPPLAEGERWRMVVGAAASGQYLCAFHPVMEARLIVDPAHLLQEQTQ